jgi:hypothetical protein
MIFFLFNDLEKLLSEIFNLLHDFFFNCLKWLLFSRKNTGSVNKSKQTQCRERKDSYRYSSHLKIFGILSVFATSLHLILCSLNKMK